MPRSKRCNKQGCGSGYGWIRMFWSDSVLKVGSGSDWLDPDPFIFSKVGLKFPPTEETDREEK